MAEPITVKLGGIDYAVPQLNLGQMRAVTKAFSGDRDSISFDILGIALKRATPSVANVDDLVAELPEIGAAVNAILLAAGFKKDDAANPTAAAPATL